MHINTKTGKLDLLKRERETLKNAIDILALLQKHGDAETSNLADMAADKISDVLQSLNAAEPIAAPY